MKIVNSVIIFLFVFLVIYSCSNSDNNPSAPPNTQSAAAYYPGNVGSSFNYRIDTLNTVTGNFDSIGTQSVEFINSETVENILIFTQKNIVSVNDSMVNVNVKFWRTDAAVYFVVDTSRFSDLIDQIPDSLRSNINFEIDSEMIILSAPLVLGKNWNAFKLNAVVQNIGATITLVAMAAFDEGPEEIIINALSEKITAERIRYDFQVLIPDTSNIANSETINFSANGWYGLNTGLLKLEGNAVLLNVLRTGNIDLADSSTTVRQEITSFDIK